MTDLASLDMRSEPMPLGHGRAVVFTFSEGRLEAEWLPRIPHGPSGARFLPAYRRARDEFLRRVAKRTGLTVGVLEI